MEALNARKVPWSDKNQVHFVYNKIGDSWLPGLNKIPSAEDNQTLPFSVNWAKSQGSDPLIRTGPTISQSTKTGEPLPDFFPRAEKHRISAKEKIGTKQ